MTTLTTEVKCANTFKAQNGVRGLTDRVSGWTRCFVPSPAHEHMVTSLLDCKRPLVVAAVISVWKDRPSVGQCDK